MNHTRQTTVIIPNWNGSRFLDHCLAGLRQQTDKDFDTVVVDNGSEDGSAALVEERFPEVRLIRLDRNRGFAGAMNIGLAAAKGEYVAFLNNDCEPYAKWLEELVACLARHSRAAAATSKLLRLDDPEIIDGAGDVLSSYFRAYERGRGEPDYGQYDREVEVFGASGAASLWRRDVVRQIGAFDEDFFAYYEDVDLSFRARLSGYECWYAPCAVVLHARAGTSSRLADEFAHFHSVRNRCAMVLKDVPGPLLFRSAPRIAFGEALTLARALRERQARHALRAYRDVAKSTPRWLRRRRQIQARRALSASELAWSLTPGYPRLRARIRDVLRNAPAPVTL